MDEFDFIKLSSNIFKKRAKGILVGAGEDDCAVVRIGDKNVVLTTDCVHKKTDFPPEMTFEEIGHMALAVNLSDIAGCGAKPVYFLFTITLDKESASVNAENDNKREKGKRKPQTNFKKILKGIRLLADRFDVSVVGGDIDFGDELSISGFAIGFAENYLTQSGAKFGDDVYISYLPGKAQLTLNQLISGIRREDTPYPEKLYTPLPQVEKGINLSKSDCINSLTDVSDSLAISLHLVSQKSGVKIIIDRDLLPLEHLTDYVGKDDALNLFLYAGGDFGLLYTKSNTDMFSRSQIPDEEDIKIGKVVKGKGVWLKEGEKLKKIEFKGYQHL